jgi:hypothetical protein
MNKTKIVVQMPADAAKRILDDPAKFKAEMLKAGFDIESVQETDPHNEIIAQAKKNGFNAVASLPHHAPSNPYNEDTQPELYWAWDEGADEAGISTMYCNGILTT